MKKSFFRGYQASINCLNLEICVLRVNEARSHCPKLVVFSFLRVLINNFINQACTIRCTCPRAKKRSIDDISIELTISFYYVVKCTCGISNCVCTIFMGKDIDVL